MKNKNRLITIEDKKEIKVNNLVLDPNNPRFSKHQDEITDESKITHPKEQKETKKILEENYQVKDLKKSIKKNGYVPVDNIFVKKISKKNKYVVVEGNRRIAAIKLLLEEHKKAKRKGKKKSVLSRDKLDSMKRITCVDLTGKPEQDVRKILGLRHHGSIKEWEPLPASFDIYKQYMETLGKEKNIDQNDPKEFYYDTDYAREVAELYSVKLSEVRKKLRTYRVFIQLRKDDRVDEKKLEKKFSIINDSVNSSEPLYKEFEFNKNKFILSEEGKDRFVDLVFGGEKKEPVIKAAASGDANLRSFKYVLDKGGEEERRRIYEDRDKPGSVEATIKERLNKKTLFTALQSANSALNDVELGDISYEDFTEAAKEKFQILKKTVKKIDVILEIDSN